MNLMVLRADYLIADPDDLAASVIREGAVVIEQGKVLEVGSWSELSSRYQGVLPIFESKDKLIIPGLVNAHHHGRALDTWQVGMIDKPLELWLPSFLLYPSSNAYIETKLTAARMVLAGITTSLQAHSHPGPFRAYEKNVYTSLQAYKDIGIRTAFAMGLYDQKFLVYEQDDVFRQRLSKSLKAELLRFFKPEDVYISTDRYFELFEVLVNTYAKDDGVQLLLNPIGLHWASNELLRRMRREMQRLNVGFHIHLLETPYQAAYAQKTFAKTAVEVLADYDLLGPKSSIAHAVWSSEKDSLLYAKTQTTLTTNPSSNLRLGSGVAPLVSMFDQSVNVALGTDSMSLFGGDDLLSEMTLLQGLHRPTGHDSPWISPYEALRIATVGGAQAATLQGKVGKLLSGYYADLAVIDMSRFKQPFLNPEVDLIALALSRAKSSDVETVLVGGKILVENQKLTQTNILDLENEFIESILVEDFKAKKDFLIRLEPHLRTFYSDLLSKQG